MIGVILYTLMEFVNFYLAYKIIFGIQFTKRKLPYAIVVLSACVVQIAVLYLVDDTWRDIVAVVIGLFAAIILAESKKLKTILLYPIVFLLSSFVNILGSYGVAILMGITQEMVGDSIALTLLSECTGIIVFCAYDIAAKKKKREEFPLTIGQYTILLIGVICFWVVVSFVQLLIQGELAIVSEMGEMTAVASVIIALFFVVLSMWQQITWKKALQYRMDNEKYEVFLSGQEEHIRMLILEDEKRRKLRHDMNAHMLALDAMAKNEEWDKLREYLGQMKDSLEESTVNKYTMVSAVDAIVDEWHNRTLECQAEWSWEGNIKLTDRVSVFELCTVFSNLLSNAVEAIEKVNGNGRIQIKVSGFQGKIVISIGNTCGTIQERHGKLHTTKGDEIFHGLGLKNVEEIVKKHDGSIDYTVKENWFQVNIVL